ncbi:MAG: four helix bundle protein [Patescibacteria group bacterium]
MLELNSSHNYKVTPPPRILPVLSKVKEAYLTWFKSYQDIPKAHRHSLGQRIDTLFVEVIEAISAASFLSREEKQPYVRLAIKKLDTLRVLLMILWETKSFDDKKYIALSLILDEVGKMLGGWNGQLTKQNSPKKPGEK